MNPKYSVRFCVVICCYYFLFSGCSSPGFIDDTKLLTFSATSETPAVLLAERIYTIKSRTKVTEKNHLILVMGSAESSNRWLIQQNNPMIRLSRFDIRLIRNGKEIEKESKKDLYSFAENGYRSISEQRYLVPSLVNEIQPGDWVELISESENDLIGLGLTFSLDEFPEISRNLSVEFISPDSLSYSVFVRNDTLNVQTEKRDGLTHKKLFWAKKTPATPGKLEAKTRQPIVFATPGLTNESWNGFSAYYRDLIKTRTSEYPSVKKLADSLTAGLSDPVEKMKALFNFCQTGFRYEQVYLSRGEFIPNSLSDILNHKYADCKDYSLLIWSLARSVGIQARLALVMRERGVPFYSDVPASQFNHLIVEWSFNGITYWYDGTNRISIPGLPGDDLINQKALVISENAGEIKSIRESGSNRIDVSGTLTQISKNLKGTLNFELKGEFALTMNYAGLFLNELDFRKFLQRWLNEQTSEEVSITDISWKIKPEMANVSCNIQIPNSVTIINGKNITSLNRIFTGMFPFRKTDLNPESLFYYPAFNRGRIDVQLLNADGSKQQQVLDFELPAGPFYTSEEKNAFILSAGDYLKKLNQSIPF
ncbi:MAG: transglutaminase domain-containing protein [Bacteroidetes bacterium]|nr:transglutaminase domain-containing protein [Bacteroidota bacterium]